MNIFLISNMYPSSSNPDYGVFVRNFKEKLQERGISFPYISVISKKGKGGVQKGIIYLKHYLSIARKYIKNDYDIIYIHYVSHNAPIFLLLLTFLKKKTPIVVNVHGSDVIKYNSGFFGIANKFLLKRTDTIVVPSKYFYDIIVSEFPFFNPANVFVNPSGGIDSKVFYRTNEPPELNPELLKIGFVSRIEVGKGWDIYLRALSLLKRKNIEFKAIIAGNGNQINKMLDEINALNLSVEVEYLGVVKQDRLRLVYNNIDIFVFSSIREAESLGLVGLEAMACGTPIIASDMAGPKTYVKNNENGFLVKPGDYLEIAKTLICYKNLPSVKKEKIRLEALKTAKPYCSESTADLLVEKLRYINTE